MLKNLFIIAFIILSLFSKEENDFAKIFPKDYRKALVFLQSNQTALKQSAYKYKHDVKFLSAIVFPELMRYSFIKDLAETTALEYAYTQKGSKLIDFSIGPFQMKPSFIEALEQEIENSDSLKKYYSDLITPLSRNELKTRTLRVSRLKKLKWQLSYLNCFLSIMDERYKNENFSNEKDRLKFYSAAYNTGFQKKSEEIRSAETFSFFPYGKLYQGKQYAYSDIVWYFYEHVFLKSKITTHT